jgi:hypothetical protein
MMIRQWVFPEPKNNRSGIVGDWFGIQGIVRRRESFKPILFPRAIASAKKPKGPELFHSPLWDRSITD